MSKLIFWQYIGWGILALIIIGVIVVITMLIKDSKRKKESPVALPSLRPVNTEEEKKRAIFDGSEPAIAPLSRRARKQGADGSTPAKDSLPAKPSAFFDSEDDDDFSLPSGSD
ncbi:MAG: hypothetical protein H9W81_12835 [Enterococcus sp.]|nr:hypothetical protein [Enterococcus sp.]